MAAGDAATRNGFTLEWFDVKRRSATHRNALGGAREASAGLQRRKGRHGARSPADSNGRGESGSRISILCKQILYPLDPRLAEQSVGSQHEHCQQRQIRGDAPEAASQRLIEVSGAETLQHATAIAAMIVPAMLSRPPSMTMGKTFSPIRATPKPPPVTKVHRMPATRATMPLK